MWENRRNTENKLNDYFEHTTWKFSLILALIVVFMCDATVLNEFVENARCEPAFRLWLPKLISV